MKQEHRDKITKAIELCHENFEYLVHAIDAHYKDDAKALKHLLYNETVFAGGMFRSTFTNTPLNDIDIFFTSIHAAAEFKHILYMSKKKMLFTVSKQDTFILKPDLKPAVSLITQRANEPATLIAGFDFSFNKHFYRMKDCTMTFDRETFNKEGRVTNEEAEPYVTMVRALKFAQQGFKIEQESLLELIVNCSNRRCSLGRELQMQTLRDLVNGSGDEKPTKNKYIYYQGYTEKDYFGFEGPVLTDTTAEQVFAYNPTPNNGVALQNIVHPTAGHWLVARGG